MNEDHEQSTDDGTDVPSGPIYRERTCSECGKPLGGTIDTCYECGGEKRKRTRDERLADAVYWKIDLGVDPKLIEAAHEE